MNDATRFESWDRDTPTWRARIEGMLELPTGKLIVCDLVQASLDRSKARSPFVLGPIAVAPGTYEVVSASDPSNGKLAFAGVRAKATRAARWERAGTFDNARARYACFVEESGLASARSEPGFYERLDPWVDRLLEENADVKSWWAVTTIDTRSGRAFAFLASAEGTKLPVHVGHDERGNAVAVVVDMSV